MNRESKEDRPVLLACPDSRPPAYEAAAALAGAGLLREFVTASFYDPGGRLARWGSRIAPRSFAAAEHRLLRRTHPAIDPGRVHSIVSYDLALQIENRLPAGQLGRLVARARTWSFDRAIARRLVRTRAQVLFLFSDTGSRLALPLAQRLAVPSILSIVHGDVDEETAILAREQSVDPAFAEIYLGDVAIDRHQLAWLHDRRRAERGLAQRILVPSPYLRSRLLSQGVEPGRIEVIPYAADCRRFQPRSRPNPDSGCTFLFAGGISGRKGIKYLLEAWQSIRRPGFRLQLLGPLPRNTRALEPYLDQVELLGRVSHSAMPERLSQADVFVFPSLFEGSAVVTYEALACGLPCIVTPNAGSVARDGVEGLVTPPGDARALAAAMVRLGENPDLRRRMAAAARTRALEFDWPRYHAAVARVVEEITAESTTAAPVRRQTPIQNLLDAAT